MVNLLREVGLCLNISYISLPDFRKKESATLWLCIGNNIVVGWVGLIAFLPRILCQLSIIHIFNVEDIIQHRCLISQKCFRSCFLSTEHSAVSAADNSCFGSHTHQSCVFIFVPNLFVFRFTFDDFVFVFVLFQLPQQLYTYIGN